MIQQSKTCQKEGKDRREGVRIVLAAAEMAMAAAGAKLPNPWEAVGRGTEVGRALFALYNGYGVARNRGNKYSDHNRMKIMERISAHGLPDLCYIPPDPPKPKKPVVKVPRFHKKQIRWDAIPQVLLMRGRRKGAQILTQLKEEVKQKDQPPQPKRPLLDEKEKARLQEIFEWSGRDVEDEEEAESEVPKVPRKPPPPKGSVEEQEMLIEAIANEIEERKQFLDRMYELGRGPKYEPVIRLEIQERVRQMQLLDKNISLMDKERLEDRAHQFTRSSSQSRHRSQGDQKAHSTASSRSAYRDQEKTEFQEQLEAVRRENMALQGEACARTVQGDDEFTETEKDLSFSEKSFAQQSVSSANSIKSGHEMRNRTCQLRTPSLRTVGPGSLKSLSNCDDVSIASPHSSNCSSVQSGSIRSSLKSIKSMSSMRSGANSSRHSLVSM